MIFNVEFDIAINSEYLANSSFSTRYDNPINNMQYLIGIHNLNERLTLSQNAELFTKATFSEVWILLKLSWHNCWCCCFLNLCLPQPARIEKQITQTGEIKNTTGKDSVKAFCFQFYVLHPHMIFYRVDDRAFLGRASIKIIAQSLCTLNNTHIFMVSEYQNICWWSWGQQKKYFQKCVYILEIKK